MKLALVRLFRFTDRLLAVEFEVKQTQISKKEALSKGNQIVTKFRQIVDEAKSQSKPEDLERIRELEEQIKNLNCENELPETREIETKISETVVAMGINQRVEKEINVRLNKFSQILAYLTTFFALIFLFGVSVGYFGVAEGPLVWVNLGLSVLTLFGLGLTGVVDKLALAILRKVV